VTVPPAIPWQITGNHWVALPCVHPADGSLHCVGVVSHALRGAIELAGASGFAAGTAPALLRVSVEVDGTATEIGGERMAWQRVAEWLPTFNTTAGPLVVRGTVFAPFGRAADLPGFVYAVSLENRSDRALTVALSAGGVFGACEHRVRTSRRVPAALSGAAREDALLLGVDDPSVPVALALAGEEMVSHLHTASDGTIAWALRRDLTLAPGARVETAVYGAVAPDPDGAVAMLSSMRAAGWRALADATRAALDALQQSTGVAAADRVINRHLVFAYFFAAARALDDARWYLVRSRAPWNGAGLTCRDWDALMWTIPAVQLADPDLARELLVRVCEMHGYAAGRGVNYLDGAPFDVAPTTAAIAAYPVAVDRYIAQTGDDRIVEEPPVADALYGAADDLASQRDPSVALYATACTPSGAHAPFPYVLHANAIVAQALDILRQTLDEKSAEKVEEGDVVRAALRRHLALDRDTARAALATATDLRGAFSSADDPVGSAYWLPLYQALPRDDSLYRRTLRRLDAPAANASLAARCARLIGPESAQELDWLRRAPLDGGLAAALVDEAGAAAADGADAALSGLIAYAVWYAVSVLGVAP